MIHLSSTVIGTGGFDFGFEAAEPDSFSVDGDFGDPFSGGFFEINADISRGGIFPGFSLVALVLRVGGEAEVVPSVVEAIAIFVVNEKALRGI
jgi:hypothetical protein